MAKLENILNIILIIIFIVNLIKKKTKLKGNIKKDKVTRLKNMDGT